MLIHLHMMVTLGGVGTFAKEKVLELILFNLEKREVFRCSPDIRMAFRLEYCFDPF